MAKAGDELLNPVTGLRTVFRKTARETSGELLQVDWISEPGWTTGPDHVHPRQEERFEVLSGRLGLRADGIERVHGVGDVILVSAGSPHAAWNAGDDEVHVLVDFVPALRTESLRNPGRAGARWEDQRGGGAQEPAGAGARPAPLRGRDLLRQASAGRPEGDLWSVGQSRLAARVSSRIPLSLCQAQRGFPDGSVTRRGTRIVLEAYVLADFHPPARVDL
jgi:quercetin dioxygenase-like cupin family protein